MYIHGYNIASSDTDDAILYPCIYIIQKIEKKRLIKTQVLDDCRKLAVTV